MGPLIPPGWREVEGALERENRDPDIALHWNKVTLRWWTHVANAVTDRGHELAAKTNELT